jgi:hypothetical protein
MNGGDDLDAPQLRGQGATSATRDGVIDMKAATTSGAAGQPVASRTAETSETAHDNALPIAAHAKLSEGDIS